MDRLHPLVARAWELFDERADVDQASTFLRDCERQTDPDFDAVKAARCIISALHLKRGDTTRAERVMKCAYRGVHGRGLSRSWSKAYERARGLVPALEVLLKHLLQMDRALPRYYRTGLSTSGPMPERSQYVVFDSQQLSVLRAYEFMSVLCPEHDRPPSVPPSLIESLPLAPAAFGRAESGTGEPFFEEVDWICAADPHTGEGVIRQQDQRHWDLQFLKGTPLVHVRSAVRAFLAEARIYDPEERWGHTVWRNGRGAADT